jgi:hypothetical protein
LYWKCRNSKSDRPATFMNMKYLFEKQYGYAPPSTLKNMPKEGSPDWRRVVKYVKWKDLQR